MGPDLRFAAGAVFRVPAAFLGAARFAAVPPRRPADGAGFFEVFFADFFAVFAFAMTTSVSNAAVAMNGKL
jgi:hypothetical protein